MKDRRSSLGLCVASALLLAAVCASCSRSEPPSPPAKPGGSGGSGGSGRTSAPGAGAVSGVGAVSKSGQKVEILSATDQERFALAATRAATAKEMGENKVKAAAPLLRGYTRDGDPEVRYWCLYALGEIGDIENIEAVRAAIQDKEPKVRLAAVQALRKLPCQTAENGLLDALKDVEEPKVRVEAARGLIGTQNPVAIQALAEAFGDPEPGVREAVDAALVKAGPLANAHVAGRIGGRESDPESIKRSLAILAKIAQPETAPAYVAALHWALREDTRADAKLKQEVRKIALDALAAAGEQGLRAMQPIISGSSSDMSSTGVIKRTGPYEARDSAPLALKEAVAEALGRMGKLAVAPISQRVLERNTFPNPAEIKLWVRTLGEIGDPAAKPALIKARAMGFSGMAETVEEAVKKIEAKSGAKLDLPPLPGK